MKTWQKIIFFFILIVFIYLRLTPIINQTVPYTYDQGRDFLKAEEIVRYKNLTFIGPTTGIMGLNHGAWWYYLITIPFVIFNGNPVGFYYFMFFLSLIANLTFAYFIYKEFGTFLSLIFFSIVSVSPYFSSLSIFASNNIITPYVVGLFIISTYYLFKSKQNYWLFFTVLFLGFILEFEVSFGLFIIPSFIFLMLFFKTIRNKVLSIKNVGLFIAGFIIPFSPRILFEIKNKFIQTKTLINYFLQPGLNNPKPMDVIFQERMKMFWSYLKDIFYNHNQIITFIFLGLTIYLLIRYRKKIINYSFLLFLSALLIVLFLLSLLYRDNFWTNYYEGIQYIFLFLMVLSLSVLTKIKNGKKITYLIVLFLLILNIIGFVKNIQSSKTKVITGLKSASLTVKYIYKNVGKNNFCLKIYTPPVIPYTYDYLISYYSRVHDLKKPSIDFINNQCWFIVEKDNYQFRVDEWRKNNQPKEGILISTKKFNDDFVIELWSDKIK